MIRGLTYEVKRIVIKTMDGEMFIYENATIKICNDVLTVEIEKGSSAFPLKNVIFYSWEA